MKNPIAIIGAMNEEVSTLGQKMNAVHKERISLNDLPIVSGTLAGREVVLARCGIGKVNAALATQYIIDRFQPQAVINTGVAGGLSPHALIGDLVIGENSLQHDFDVRHLNYSKGTIPRLEVSTFPADPGLVDLAVKAAQQELEQKRVHKGLIVSGDQFISSREQKQKILAHFPAAVCAEMEGAAIAQAAYVNRIPHVIVRAISDQADNTAPADFQAYLLRIIPTLNAVIAGLVRSVPPSAK